METDDVIGEFGKSSLPLEDMTFQGANGLLVVGILDG